MCFIWNVSLVHLPSTISKESWDGQGVTHKSASKPPIVPGCRHISVNTKSEVKWRNHGCYKTDGCTCRGAIIHQPVGCFKKWTTCSTSLLPFGYICGDYNLKRRSVAMVHFFPFSHTLTVLSIPFNLQLQNAVRNDCARRDLHRNITVHFYVVAVLYTHLRIHTHTQVCKSFWRAWSQQQSFLDWSFDKSNCYTVHTNIL